MRAKTFRSRHFLAAAIAVGAALALSSCTPRKQVAKAPADDSGLDGDMAGGIDGKGARGDGDVEVDEVDIRNPGAREFTQTADLRPIGFDYDAYTLGAEARVTLRNNAAYLKSHPDLEVLVEGHCDDRGTSQYNLALGQKRAKSVREYYIRLGVSGRKIGTISFGEEQPACAEQSEECWTRNRRAETKIRTRVSSNGYHKKPQQQVP